MFLQTEGITASICYCHMRNEVKPVSLKSGKEIT
jgi:hypothetical protein